jgi:hypothetical protein
MVDSRRRIVDINSDEARFRARRAQKPVIRDTVDETSCQLLDSGFDCSETNLIERFDSCL